MNENALQKIVVGDYQSELLTLLDAFTEICEKHGLEYYLNAGTLLGAVRHQGFIPWDDDIDLCMPRTDYERFLTYAAGELPENLRAVWYGIQDGSEHPQYHCQIQDLDYPVVQTIASVPRETYAWIDVFPLDGMPGNAVRRAAHGLRLLYWRMRMQLSMFDTNVNIRRKNRPAPERFLVWIFDKTGWGRKSDTFAVMRKLDRVLKKYPDWGSALWVNFMGAYKLKETAAAGQYRNGAPLTFEGRKLNGPADADAVLKKLYGDDYMTPVKPPDSDDHRLYLNPTGKGEEN